MDTKWVALVAGLQVYIDTGMQTFSTSRLQTLSRTNVPACMAYQIVAILSLGMSVVGN